MFTLAAVGIAFVGLPQLIKVWQHRRTEGVSLLTYGLLITFQWVMFIHAIEIADVPFMITNGAGGSINAAVFASLVYLRRQET